MTRRVFFSFHYERDVWRASIVRNSWITKDRESAGFWDASLWEKAKKTGDAAVKKMINDALTGTSVTAVLIGSETSNRRWVQYEVKESHQRGKGLLGVYIHNIKDSDGHKDTKGDPYFGEIDKDENGNSVYFKDLYPIYDWKNDDGYSNFGKWVEDAAKAAKR